MADLSVVIPTHNRAHLVGDAIRSTLGLRDLGLMPEIIVVDDGSADHTRAVLVEFGEHIVALHVAHGERSKARNAGLARATAELVGFLDDDDLCVPEGWAELVSLLTANSELGFAYGRAVFTNSYGDELPYRSHPELLDAQSLFFSLVSRGCEISMGTIVARRTALLPAGGFREGLSAWEDWDLWLQLAFEEQGHFVNSVCAAIRNPDWDQPNSHHWTDKLAVRARYSLDEPYYLFLKESVDQEALLRFFEQLGCDAYSHRLYAISRRAFLAARELSPTLLRRPKRMAQYVIASLASK